MTAPPIVLYRDAIHASDLKGREKHFALALAQRMKVNDLVCWPSWKTVCQDLGISRATFYRYVKAVEQAGLWVRRKLENGFWGFVGILRSSNNRDCEQSQICDTFEPVTSIEQAKRREKKVDDYQSQPKSPAASPLSRPDKAHQWWPDNRGRQPVPVEQRAEIDGLRYYLAERKIYVDSLLLLYLRAWYTRQELRKAAEHATDRQPRPSKRIFAFCAQLTDAAAEKAEPVPRYQLTLEEQERRGYLSRTPSAPMWEEDDDDLEPIEDPRAYIQAAIKAAEKAEEERKLARIRKPPAPKPGFVERTKEQIRASWGLIGDYKAKREGEP